MKDIIPSNIVATSVEGYTYTRICQSIHEREVVELRRINDTRKREISTARTHIRTKMDGDGDGDIG